MTNIFGAKESVIEKERKGKKRKKREGKREKGKGKQRNEVKKY